MSKLPEGSNILVAAGFIALVLASFVLQAQVVSDDRVDTQAEREAPTAIDISPEEAVDASRPFGFNLFGGGFRAEREDGLNPEYIVQPGDRITLRIWGATTVSEEVVVDGQGNIFIPDVGPIHVAGIRNSDLTPHIERAMRAVFTQNVNIYTNLQSTQPTIVFVTGFVTTPGSYAGVASDSLLFYLGRAGGINAKQGSYRDIVVKRQGNTIAEVDLYEFLLNGKLPQVQFMDGDAIVVGARGYIVAVAGEVRNRFTFEFPQPDIEGAKLLELVRPHAHASHVLVSGSRAAGPFASYITVPELASFQLRDGDRVIFEADQREETMLVNVEGSHLGPSRFAVSRDTTLLELLDYIEVDSRLADVTAISLRRRSLARRQKVALEDSLRRLEVSVIGASSQTDEESQIRVREAELIQQFTAEARKVKPEGILVVARNGVISDIHLEPDDIITVPARSDTIMISGEVMVPQALVFSPDIDLDGYIAAVGGFTERANPDRILIVHRNGEVVDASTTEVQPGDQIMVLPAVPTKDLQIATSVSQIIFQIAVVAATIIAAFN